jgi:hypothetical protein
MIGSFRHVLPGYLHWSRYTSTRDDNFLAEMELGLCIHAMIPSEHALYLINEVIASFPLSFRVVFLVAVRSKDAFDFNSVDVSLPSGSFKHSGQLEVLICSKRIALCP